MNNKLCENCNYENDQVSSYCQKCGNPLKKNNLKSFLNSLEFGSIAGTGQKGVSSAPLAGMHLDKENRKSTKSFSVVKNHYLLEDGSWYCPYCGQHNKQIDFHCYSCFKPRP